MKIYRQGDVLLVSMSKSQATQIKPGKDLRENGRIVLAHGEVTGHAHVVEVNAPEQAEWFAPEGRDDAQAVGVLHLLAPAALKHDEHATISLPAGHYRVIRQREYSPTAIRNVAD